MKALALVAVFLVISEGKDSSLNVKSSADDTSKAVPVVSLSEAVDLPRDCEGWREEWERSQKLPGQKYLIDPDGKEGVGPFSVVCDMSTSPATTIIAHNYDGKTEVVNAPGVPDGKYFPVSYGQVTMRQIEALMAAEGECKQHLKYECHHSVLTLSGTVYSHWFSRSGHKMSYFPGGPANGKGCACSIDKSCDGGSTHLCNCDKNDATWRSDEGSITDKNLLPISKLSFADTDNPGESGFFTLSPLMCIAKQSANDFDMHFCEPAKYRTRSFWILPSMYGSAWPYDGFCVAISKTDPETNGDYQLSLDMLFMFSSKNNYGHGGVMFNVIDAVNYDVLDVSAGHLAKEPCYRIGFVRNGKYTTTADGECKHGAPRKHVWFNLRVDVRSSSLSTARLNNLFLVDFKPHFPARRRGGALAANRDRVQSAFKNYRLVF